MITIGTRVKLFVFLVIGVLVLAYIAVNYANLGQYVGLRYTYTVKVDLTEAGGLFPNSEVTYRGVSVGRVQAINLTDSGVQAILAVNNSAPKIPDEVRAVVADRSAVGEQYIDLRPGRDSGPYLSDGAEIPVSRTQLPPAVQNVLGDVDNLAASVPTKSLQILVNELYQATQGQGPNLQTLLDTSNSYLNTAQDNLPSTTQLINDSQSVLSTQVAETNALESFGANAQLLAAQLDKSDPDIRRLIGSASAAAGQVQALLTDNNPNLGVLLANLLTTSDLALSRQNGLAELLSATPAAVAAGSTVINNNGATFGMALTFFSPLPCTTGYGGTVERGGLDTSPSPPLNTNAGCTLPASSGVEVRGPANAPTGGLPPVAVPGALAVADGNGSTGHSSATLPGALGLPALPAGPTDLSGLLGMGPR